MRVCVVFILFFHLFLSSSAIIILPVTNKYLDIRPSQPTVIRNGWKNESERREEKEREEEEKKITHHELSFNLFIFRFPRRSTISPPPPSSQHPARLHNRGLISSITAGNSADHKRTRKRIIINAPFFLSFHSRLLPPLMVYIDLFLDCGDA